MGFSSSNDFFSAFYLHILVFEYCTYLNQRNISLCSGSNVELLYLDFAKAFDLVDISILLSKLKNFKITGKLLNWTKSFLKNRQQHVRVNNSLSSQRKVCSGVPQGSVLEPILFLVYIADLQMEDNCRTMSKLLKYVDDSKVLTRTKTEKDIINL